MILSTIAIVFFKGLNLGIDFKGGLNFEIKTDLSKNQISQIFDDFDSSKEILIKKEIGSNVYTIRIESGDNLPKKMVEKVCYEALSKGQFGYTPTQVKLMIQKKQQYKNKALKYRAQKWSDPELVKVCTYMTKSLNF